MRLNRDKYQNEYPEFLTCDQAAEILCCGHLTVRNMAKSGRFAYITIGKRSIRILRESLLDWLERELIKHVQGQGEPASIP